MKVNIQHMRVHGQVEMVKTRIFDWLLRLILRLVGSSNRDITVVYDEAHFHSCKFRRRYLFDRTIVNGSSLNKVQ